MSEVPRFGTLSDSVLELLAELGIIAYAFANDTLLIIPAGYKDELISKVELAVDVITHRFKELGLKLNRGKTEILLFENIPRSIKRDPEWIINDHWWCKSRT